MRKLLRRIRKRVFGAKTTPAAPKTLTLAHPRNLTPRRNTIDFTGAERFSIGRSVLASGLASYEPEVFSMMGALIETSCSSPPRPVQMFDIGSNVGVFSLAMAGLFGDAVQITAFEPMPELAQFLTSAASRNGVTIAVKQVALGKVDEQAKFYLSSQGDASNSLNERFRAHKGVIDVQVSKLDTLYGATEQAAAYVLKLDTESTEPDVLAGARGFISKHRPPIICEVLAKRTESQIEQYFRELGYVAVHITDDPSWAGATAVVGDSTYKFRDWLFLPGPASDELRAAFSRWIAAYTRR